MKTNNMAMADIIDTYDKAISVLEAHPLEVIIYLPAEGQMAYVNDIKGGTVFVAESDFDRKKIGEMFRTLLASINRNVEDVEVCYGDDENGNLAYCFIGIL